MAAVHEPSPTPCLYVAPAACMVGRVPLIPLFLAGNLTPTIPHKYSQHKGSGFPAGSCDTAAADGRRGSNVYEVNPWLWQFGRGLCFARCEFDCEVTLTQANYWIISVDSATNPSQSQFNQLEDAEPLFRHMVPHSPVHARSRANFIKRAFQLPKFSTEARDSVLKPAHTTGGCRSSPEARSQRSPWFSRPAIAAFPESHILSDSSRFKDLIIR
jgi:hypothetical protein